MTVSAGEVVYSLGKSPCSGVGLRWTDEEFTAVLDNWVSTVLFDDKGKSNIDEMFSRVVEAGFDQDRLRRVLKDEDVIEIEEWRVGEVIAEIYLTNHRSCSFPWPSRRDEKKSGSNLPGADLVGLGYDIDGDCLAFGEVKTSSERRYPPGVMYGPTGLKQQLENLRDREADRKKLFKYLCHHAESAPWREQLINAGRRYIQNSSDVQIYGFLVRDVEPHQDDLRARVNNLAFGCPEGMHIELLALYLSHNSLGGIGEVIIAQRAAENK